MAYTHRNVRYRVAGGKERTRNVRVSVEGDVKEPAVRAEIADVLAATEKVATTQITLMDGPAPPKPRKPTAKEIRELNKGELIDFIKRSDLLKDIDTDGTVKAMETAVMERLGIQG